MGFSSDKRIFLAIVTVILSLALIACDNNIPKSDEITPDTSVSISEFTVDPSTLTQGESAILSWNVADENDTVSYCFISPDVGTVAESGTKQVTPLKSTTFTLTTYVNNEAHSARSLQITVLDAEGSEVTEVTETEVCDDEADNDFDELVDCDDDDCAAEDACAVEKEVVYELTYTVDPDPAAAQILMGDSVTVAWESNYAQTKLVDEAGVESSKEYTATGTYSFLVPTVEAEETTITLTIKGYNDYGVFAGEQEVKFTATAQPVSDEPVYSASVDIDVDPNKTEFLYGQSFTYSWDITSDFSHVYLTYAGSDNGEEKSYSGEESGRGYVSVDKATSDWEFSLDVVDINGVAKTTPYTKNLHINKFGTGPASGVMSDIVQFVPTNAEGFFLFLTKSKIFGTTDYGNSLVEYPITGVEGEFTGLDIRGNTVYLGTKNGLYVALLSTEGSTFTQIVGICDNCTVSISAIYPTATERNGAQTIIVGTEMALYEVYKGSAEEIEAKKCDSGYTMYNEYCVEIHKLDTAHIDEEDYAAASHDGDPVNFLAFIPKQNSSQKAILLTESHGAFLTEDSGETFTELNFSATGGYWVDGSTGFLWNGRDNAAWAYDGSQFVTMSINDTHASVTDINFIASVGSYIFVASDDGIYYHDGNYWNVSNVTGSTDFLMGDKASRSYQVTAFSSAGESYQITWDGGVSTVGSGLIKGFLDRRIVF